MGALLAAASFSTFRVVSAAAFWSAAAVCFACIASICACICRICACNWSIVAPSASCARAEPAASPPTTAGDGGGPGRIVSRSSCRFLCSPAGGTIARRPFPGRFGRPLPRPSVSPGRRCTTSRLGEVGRGELSTGECGEDERRVRERVNCYQSSPNHLSFRASAASRGTSGAAAAARNLPWHGRPRPCGVVRFADTGEAPVPQENFWPRTASPGRNCISPPATPRAPRRRTHRRRTLRRTRLQGAGVGRRGRRSRRSAGRRRRCSRSAPRSRARTMPSSTHRHRAQRNGQRDGERADRARASPHRPRASRRRHSR